MTWEYYVDPVEPYSDAEVLLLRNWLRRHPAVYARADTWFVVTDGPRQRYGMEASGHRDRAVFYLSAVLVTSRRVRIDVSGYREQEKTLLDLVHLCQRLSRCGFFDPDGVPITADGFVAQQLRLRTPAR